MIDLRGYQRDFVNGIRQSLIGGSKAVLGVAPTGSGKTECIAFMVHGLQQQGVSSLILVHREELLYQTAATLARAGCDFRIFASQASTGSILLRLYQKFGIRTNPGANITIASLPTVAARLRRGYPIPPAQFLIPDESHHSVAKTWQQVLKHYMGKGARMVGMTATPERLDGIGLGLHCGGFFEDMIQGPTTHQLVELGWLSAPRVFSPPGYDRSGINIVAGDYDRKKSAGRARKIHGDAIAHYQKHFGGRPAIAFCCTLDHAADIARDFKEAGHKAAIIEGKMDTTERADLLEALASGKLNVLASCELIGEGVDVPAVAGIIALRQTASRALWRQQVGRALRPAVGKPHAIILDHVGNTFTHGHPLEPIEWSLDGEPPDSRQSREKASKNAVYQCMGCYCQFPSYLPSCPECGRPKRKRFNIQVVPADLDEKKEFTEKEKVNGIIWSQAAMSLEQAMELAAQHGLSVDHGAQIWKNVKTWQKTPLGKTSAA